MSPKICVSIMVLILGSSPRASAQMESAVPASPPSATASPTSPASTAAEVPLPAGAIVIQVNRAQLKFENDKMTVRAVVDSKTKRPIGVAIEKLDEASPLSKLGFKNGDVLLAVNSHVMVEPSSMLLLAKSIPVAKFHDYDVRRDGERMAWRVEFIDGPVAVAKSIPMADEKPERVIRLKKKVVESLTKDLAALLESARLVPEFDKKTNEVRCFRVVDVKPDSIFKMAGLVAGDCVMAVNDRHLDSPMAGMELYNDLSRQPGPLTYVIERKGKLKKLGVEVE